MKQVPPRFLGKIPL